MEHLLICNRVAYSEPVPARAIEEGRVYKEEGHLKLRVESSSTL